MRKVIFAVLSSWFLQRFDPGCGRECSVWQRTAPKLGQRSALGWSSTTTRRRRLKITERDSILARFYVDDGHGRAVSSGRRTGGNSCQHASGGLSRRERRPPRD